MKLFRRHHIAGLAEEQKKSLVNRILLLGGTGWRSLWMAVFCAWLPEACAKFPPATVHSGKKKFTANKARDRRVNRELRKLGWRVIRIWEHDLAKRGDACALRIADSLLSLPPR